MANPLPFEHSIAAAAATFPFLSSPFRRKCTLAASYASYVVRVHTRHGIKTLSFDVLADLFTFTAKKAAEDLGISSRTLIRVCRSLGIRRWPYLGFRSEKNVERIRQEAIENLRRKLEKDESSLPTAVLHLNAPNLRGASAKRLLQVKMPQLDLASLQKAIPSTMAFVQTNSRCSSPTLSNTTTNVSDDDERMSESDECSFILSAPMQQQQATAPLSPPLSPTAPLLTPPPMAHSFNLEIQHASPSKEADVTFLTANTCLKSKSWTAPRLSMQASATSKPTPSLMPSLSLLVDASVFTNFKKDTSAVQCTYEGSVQQLRQSHAPPRTMSMQDILASDH